MDLVIGEKKTSSDRYSLLSNSPLYNLPSGIINVPSYYMLKEKNRNSGLKVNKTVISRWLYNKQIVILFLLFF